MRTTIILDDELGERLRAQARREGKSFSAFLADAGRRALESRKSAETAPFELITFRGKGAVEGVNLDRIREIEAAEDAWRYGQGPL
ncbi:MAG: CopG family transcriptional regulator [Opitutales bacterium]